MLKTTFIVNKVCKGASSFLHYQDGLLKSHLISTYKDCFALFCFSLIKHFFCASLKTVHDMVFAFFVGMVLKNCMHCVTWLLPPCQQ